MCGLRAHILTLHRAGPRIKTNLLRKVGSFRVIADCYARPVAATSKNLCKNASFRARGRKSQNTNIVLDTFLRKNGSSMPGSLISAAARAMARHCWRKLLTRCWEWILTLLRLLGPLSFIIDRTWNFSFLPILGKACRQRHSTSLHALSSLNI